MEDESVVNNGDDFTEKLEIKQEDISDISCDLESTLNDKVHDVLKTENSEVTSLEIIGNGKVNSKFDVMGNNIETKEGNNNLEGNDNLQPSESTDKEMVQVIVNKEVIEPEKGSADTQVLENSKTMDAISENFMNKSGKCQKYSDMDLNCETSHIDLNQIESFIQEVIDDLYIADMDLKIESCKKSNLNSEQETNVKNNHNRKAQDKFVDAELTMVEDIDHLTNDLELNSKSSAVSHSKGTGDGEVHLPMKPKNETFDNDYHIETVGFTNAASGNLKKADKATSTISDDVKQAELKETNEPTNIILYNNKIQPNDMAVEQMEILTLRRALDASQKCLLDEKARHCQNMTRIKCELYKSKTQQWQEKRKSDKMLTDVMSHLTLLESQLKKEQKKLLVEMKNKKELIEKQKQELMKLRDQNDQLYNAIKEICANGGMNGYMRDKKKNGNTDAWDNGGGKGNKERKGFGKLGSMRDKFSSKNRSSLELNNFNLEKYLIKDARMCSSQDDIHALFEEHRDNSHRYKLSPVERKQITVTRNTNEHGHGQHLKSLQNCDACHDDLNKSDTEARHLSDQGSPNDMSFTNHGQIHREHDIFDEDDDEDGRKFPFSSTHINTVINEEETLGPIVSYSDMMSMGSMPALSNMNDDNGFYAGKNHPHSTSSVDLMSIQQQKQNQYLADVHIKDKVSAEVSTPPQSPSSVHGKTEKTPFQTFKTMFQRKGSKIKESKKRSVSLSQNTSGEYTEALKKHFQKYDMQ